MFPDQSSHRVTAPAALVFTPRSGRSQSARPLAGMAGVSPPVTVIFTTEEVLLWPRLSVATVVSATAPAVFNFKEPEYGALVSLAKGAPFAKNSRRTMLPSVS